MAVEKREGFGQLPDPHSAPAPIFETPHYQVVVARMSNGPEAEPRELRIRFVVLAKEYPVICGHSGLEGEAIGLALSAEAMYAMAREAAEEAKARGYQA